MQLIKTTRIVKVLVIIAALFISAPVLADDFLLQVMHTDAYEVMGQKQPAIDDTTIIWLTDGKACTQNPDNSSVIYNAEENSIYMLNNEKKEYSVIQLGQAAGDAKGESGDESQAAMMKRAQAMMGKPKITVTLSEETKKIGDWQTKKYDVNLAMAMMASKQQMWVTEDIKIDNSALHAVSGGMMAQMPGFADIIEQMKQIKGVPVLTVTSASVMGQKIITTTELIEYSEKDAPDGIYDVPNGYKKVEMNMGRGMGMGGH
ncbi:MAG: DUF4412 domain-containing protein [candidate division Zixibacteria bacterium]|nr:DUF4412 domain-containing protein [candidate division Zixibacteria bacterium]